MTPAARLQALIELAHELQISTKPADGFVSAYFRNRRYIGAKDRRYISEHFYNLLRFYGRLNWHIESNEKTKKLDKPRLFIFAYFIFVEQENGKNLNQDCDGTKHAPDILSADEKYLIKKWQDTEFMPEAMPESVRLECPEWAYEPFKKLFGAQFPDVMNAMAESAILHLRANTLMANRDKAMEALRAEGIECHAGDISPLAIHVKGRPPLGQSHYFRKGWFEIQDEGSQLIALLCEAQSGQQVVDFCAGAGGKTLALGAMMQNKGRLVACDVVELRLHRSKERLRRAGLHNVETRLLSSENDKWVKRSKEQFDVVLVDAPCSGAGTWRRNPDTRWRQISLGIDTLVPLQQSILQSAARLVKKGGRLVYATCSLLPEENHEQIHKFLAEHSDFKIMPVRDIWPRAVGTKLPAHIDDMMQLNPADHGTDGFFTAVLERVS